MKCKECTNLRVVAYEQPLNRHIALVCKYIADNGGSADFRSERARAHGNNTTNAAYFGFVENIGERLWRLTEKGQRFVKGEPMPSAITYFFRDVVEESPTKITIDDALSVDLRYKTVEPKGEWLEKRRAEHFSQQTLL